MVGAGGGGSQIVAGSGSVVRASVLASHRPWKGGGRVTARERGREERRHGGKEGGRVEVEGGR